ncbi:MAG: STAS domain-containing protein [Chitinispirillaceae bacterium]|nr:STAS domain-containing protein [Chitinispirillaceae bacterium]
MQIEEHTGTFTLAIPRHCTGTEVKTVAAEIARLYGQAVPAMLVLDFSVTELIDSNGIGTLVSVAKEAHARQVPLRLRNLNETLTQLFNQTGLDRIFTIERGEKIITATVNFFEPAYDVKLQITPEPVGEVEIFHLSGVMSHPVGSSIFKQRLLLSLSRSKKVLLDLEELSFIDSLSISALLRMNNLLTTTGGSMGICGAAFIVSDLLETLNIGTIIPLYSSREEALSSLVSQDG